jgi:NitT/TauT family transport system substrate-binding protein
LEALRTASMLAAATLAPLRLSAADRALDIGATTNESTGTLFYASDLGLFHKLGLDPKFTILTNPGPTVGAILGGTLGIAGTAVSSIALAVEKGIPIQLIAPASIYLSSVPTNAVVVLKDSPLKTATDLTGKTMATRDINNMSYLGARAWVDKNGGDSKSLKWLEVPDAQHAAALQAGRIDAASTGEPALDDALHGGQVRVLGKCFDAIAPRFLIGAYFSSNAYAKANPDIVRAFADAVSQAARWANQPKNHPQSAQMLAHYGMVAPGADATRIVYAEQMRAADIQPVLDVMATYGFLQSPLKAADLVSPVVRLV